MAELKTKKTTASVAAFLSAIPDSQQREDAKRVCALMEKVTKERPAMWGTAIVGFGDCHYAYDSGCTGNWFYSGFSPRKGNLTLYLTGGFTPKRLAELGKCTAGRSCLYIKKLEHVSMPVLEAMIREGFAQAKRTFLPGPMSAGDAKSTPKKKAVKKSPTRRAPTKKTAARRNVVARR